MNPLRASYLEALGIRRWVRRIPAEPGSESPAAEGALAEPSVDAPTGQGASGWRLGEAEGRCLLLCGDEQEADTVLAGDLARCLRGGTVWGWPEPDGGHPALPEALRQSAPAALIVFGEALAHAAFAGEAPERIGSAPVLVAPALAELRSSPARRRDCWQLLQSLAGPGSRGEEEAS